MLLTSYFLTYSLKKKKVGEIFIFPLFGNSLL